MTRLTELVQVLTEPHLRVDYSEDGGLIHGTEDGLLLQLEQAISATTSSQSGGGGASKHTVPVDLGAVDLYRSIVKEVGSYLSPKWKLRPLIVQVQHHAHQVPDEETERMLERWTDSIREHLEPEPRRPLPGVACPACLAAFLPRILDGERVLIPVITVWTKTLVAECQACEERWEGQTGLLRLAGQQRGFEDRPSQVEGGSAGEPVEDHPSTYRGV